MNSHHQPGVIPAPGTSRPTQPAGFARLSTACPHRVSCRSRLSPTLCIKRHPASRSCVQVGIPGLIAALQRPAQRPRTRKHTLHTLEMPDADRRLVHTSVSRANNCRACSYIQTSADVSKAPVRLRWMKKSSLSLSFNERPSRFTWQPTGSAAIRHPATGSADRTPSFVVRELHVRVVVHT